MPAYRQGVFTLFYILTTVLHIETSHACLSARSFYSTELQNVKIPEGFKSCLPIGKVFLLYMVDRNGVVHNVKSCLPIGKEFLLYLGSSTQRWLRSNLVMPAYRQVIFTLFSREYSSGLVQSSHACLSARSFYSMQ